MEVGRNPGRFAKARQFAGPPGALQGAGEHLGEVHSPEHPAEPGCPALPVLGEGQVGAAGVPAVEGPLGFPVTDDEDLLDHCRGSFEW